MASVPIKRLACVLSAAGLCVALSVPAGAAASGGHWLRVGDAQSFLRLAPGNYPEGIAVGKRGIVYLGNRRDDGEHYVSEILTIARDGSVSTVAELAQLERDGDPGDDGVLGLAVDSRGAVYAAVVSPDPTVHGVWRITCNGSRRARLPGSERMTFPNALTFDTRGNLYVTDSFGGAVWRFPLVGTRRQPAYGSGWPWAEHELLAPAPDDPLGFPLPGANGIGFDRPNRLYVANTEKGLIAQVPINRDGSAGEATLVATGLATADGLAVDGSGGVHVVIPGHALLGTSPLVRVDPRTGSTTSGVGPSEWDEFDVPLSVAFGTGRHRTRILATNGDLPGVPPEARLPGVVEVNVGLPGSFAG
jgi:sugar lactone lactonase YvrE